MTDRPDPEVAIFAGARRLPAARRGAFLDQACAGDAALRDHIEELLQSSDEAGNFLENPAAVPPGEAVRIPPVPAEMPGDRIGRYKLLQQIGEGGCGVVYMAEQEEPVRRRVALKVIKLGMDTKSVIARFEAERQALAMMDHPNIARVFDAGATATGRPYFVMELVRGVKITDFCDENKVPTQERLKLFIQVCQAIQHAHQKGIIHRDIKPSNILVTINDGVPVPKVIDFGIAKATQGRLTDQTLFTAFEQFLGTPAYMSPEQAVMTSLDIDTRSDIYSLGVLLYELLTGKTPFEQKELLAAGLDEMRRTIKEKEPLKPSTRLSAMVRNELTTTANRRQTEPPRLIHSVRGDLDWIVMKALEKDRARRYETANGFARDIQRHLNDEPVVARPPSRLYEFQKTVRRHKFGFAAAALIGLVLLVSTGISAWQAVRATRATRDALAARKQAEANEKQAGEAQAGEKTQRQKAEALAVENEKNYQTARQNLYAADMAEAARRLKENDFARARQLVEGQQPKPGEEDLRGVEWRYLWAASGGNQIATLDAGSAVTAVDVSPDGKLIAAGCEDGKVKVWDSATLKTVATLQDQSNSICRELRFAPAGNVLATSYGAKITLWDTASLNRVREISLGQFSVNNFAYSPDGKFLAVSADESPILFCDATTGEKLFSLPEGSGPVAFSRDGTSIATGGGSLKIWNVASRRLIRSIGSGEPWGLCLSADGGTVFLSTYQGVDLWNVADGAHETVLSPDSGIGKLSLSPDGRLLACGSAGGRGRIVLWNWNERQLLRDFYGHKSAGIQGLAFTPDGGILVSGSSDGTVRLWSTERAPTRPSAFIARVRNIYNGDDLCLFSADGKWLAAPEQDDIQIVDVEHCRVSSVLPTTALLAGFLPDGHTLLACGTVANQIQIELWDWRTRTDKAIPLRGLPPGDITALALSPDGAQMALIVGSRLYSVNPQTGECAFLDLSLTPSWMGLAFSPDGHYLAAGNGNQTLLCHWPQVTNFVGLPVRSGVKKPFFSKDGSRLMTGEWQGEVRVWEVPSGRLLFALAGGTDISAGSFSADNLTLATAAGYTARWWSLRTGRQLMSFDDSRSIGFSPDGQVIAQIRSDGTLYLAHLPMLHDIDNQQPKTLAQLAEAEKSPAGVFEPVMTKTAGLVWTGELGWLKSLKKTGLKFTSTQQSDGTWAANLSNTKFSDLTLLKGAPISSLTLANTAVSDLSPLQGMPITSLHLGGTVVTNLEPLRGMPLTSLVIYDTPVTDLSPLAGMPLQRFHLGGTKVKDLSALRGMPLTYLRLHGCSELADISPLADCKDLQELTLPPNAKNIEFLRDLPSVKLIGFTEDQTSFEPDKTAAEFWADYAAAKTKAVVFAEKAAAETHREDPKILDILAAAYAEAGQFTNAVRVQQEAIALPRPDEEKKDLALRLKLYQYNYPYRDDGELAQLAAARLREGKFAEAEVLARECLSLREKTIPDNWRTFNAQSMLGGSLLGQKKYAEAEPLLLSGYKGMKQREAGIPPEGKPRLSETLQRLVQLYGATDRLDPKHFDETLPMQELADACLAVGRDKEAITFLEQYCKSNPQDMYTWVTLATWQTWLGQDTDYEATRRRMVQQAQGTDLAATAEQAAKACCLRPSADAALLAKALTLARQGVELGKSNYDLPWYQMCLGLAEYRNGHYADAEGALTIAEQTGGGNVGGRLQIERTAGLVRAMSLFRQDKMEEARKVFSQAEAQMPPLPKDERTPIVDGASHDDLICWLFYKEAKALIEGPSAPVAEKSEPK